MRNKSAAHLGPANPHSGATFNQCETRALLRAARDLFAAHWRICKLSSLWPPPLQLVSLCFVLLSLFGAPTQAAVILNEVMPHDRRWVPDETGDFSGWAELYNTGPNAVDLAGYGLSENPEQPFHWTFPSVAILPGQSMMVFTSGKGRRTPADAWARASTSDPLFDPSGVAGLRWWLDASDVGTIQSSDGRVERWIDKSGRTLETTNGTVRFDATALVESQRPHWIQDPGTGLPAVRFDGEHHLLTFAGIQEIQTVFWVLREPKTSSDSFRPFLGHDTDPTLVRNFDRLIFPRSHATWLDGVPVDPRYTRLPHGRVSLTVMLSLPAQANSLAQSLKYPDLRWAGDMMEILVYDRVLTEDERLRVQAYLDRKWWLPAQALHTNFKLTEEMALYLTAPDGSTVDVAPPVIATHEVSRGRSSHGDSWEWFEQPTPGVTNNTPSALFGVLPPPELDPKPGIFTNQVFVSIVGPAASQAIVYYSTDGSDPTTLRYTGPIEIQGNQTLRTRAVAPGYVPSPIITGTYLQPLQGGLPVVALTTAPQNLWDESRGIYTSGPTNSEFYPNFARDWERPVHLEWFEPDGTRRLEIDAGIKIHGQFSRAYPQRSLRLQFRDRYGSDTLKFPVFPGNPVAEFESLILRNFGNDWNISCMRDAVGHALGEQVGLETQAWRPVHVVLNGEYFGLHELRERLDANHIAAHVGVKSDSVDVIRNTSDIIAGDILAYQQDGLKVNQMDLTSETDFRDATARIDLDNFATWLALEIYADNSDWPQNNITVWRERSPAGRWRWALNDLDSTFNGWGFGVETNTLHRALQQTPISNERLSAVDFVVQIPLHTAFRDRFLNRFADLLNTTLSASNVHHQIERIHASLAPAMPLQIQRWGSESNGLVTLDSMATWESNVDVLRDFANRRTAILWNQLIAEFGLEGTAPLTLQINASEGIQDLRVNSIQLPTSEPSWTGLYFQTIPVTVSVSPKPGWRFIGWEGRSETNASLTLLIPEGERLVPLLIPDQASRIHPLADGPFVFTRWDASNPAGTFPAAMFFQQTTNKDPGLEVELEGLWNLPYNRDSRSRIVGRGESGISFVNTSDEASGGGFIGAAVVRLDTRGHIAHRVSWTASTLAPNNRPYALRLQWRLGNSGPFHDILTPPNLDPVQYTRSTIAGHSTVFANIPLPSAADNQPEVQVRWKYFAMETTTTGSRAELGLDEIHIEAYPMPKHPPVVSLEWREGVPTLFTSLAVPGQVTVLFSEDLSMWSVLESRRVESPGPIEFALPREVPQSRFFQLKIE